MTDTKSEISTECQRENCDEDPVYLLFLPGWGESRPVCPRELRQVDNGVDTRTLVRAGYAKQIGEPGDLPQQPDLLADRMTKSMLEDHMGWSN